MLHFSEKITVHKIQREKKIIQKRFLNKQTNSRHESLVLLIESSIRYTGLLFSDLDNIRWLVNVATICFLTTNVTQLITLVMVKDDPDKLFECFSVLSFCAMGTLKLISLRGNYKQWRVLIDQVSTLEEGQLDDDRTSVEYESDEEHQHSFPFYAHIELYTKKFRSAKNLLRRIYCSTAIIFILSPFIEYAVLKNENKRYPHILPGWTPRDEYIFVYITMIVFETIGSVYCVCVHIAFDSTAIGLMIFACGQFQLIRSYSENIGGSGRMCMVIKQRDVRAHFRITKCQRIHCLLINLITKLDKLLQDILGVYFIVATLTLCSVAVRLQSEDLSRMQLISLMQYLCATLTQLFLYCRYGDMVFAKSSLGPGEGANGASWWCLGPRACRELALLSAGMAQPRRLRAGFFHFLDLPSFIQIVRSAYSYYAVARQKSQ